VSISPLLATAREEKGGASGCQVLIARLNHDKYVNNTSADIFQEV